MVWTAYVADRLEGWVEICVIREDDAEIVNARLGVEDEVDGELDVDAFLARSLGIAVVQRANVRVAEPAARTVPRCDLALRRSYPFGPVGRRVVNPLGPVDSLAGAPRLVRRREEPVDHRRGRAPWTQYLREWVSLGCTVSHPCHADCRSTKNRRSRAVAGVAGPVGLELSHRVR